MKPDFEKLSMKIVGDVFQDYVYGLSYEEILEITMNNLKKAFEEKEEFYVNGG